MVPGRTRHPNNINKTRMYNNLQEEESRHTPLAKLTQKGVPFRWTDQCEERYKKFKLKPYEKNYPFYDLGLETIVHALKIWRHYLYNVSCKTNTLADTLSTKAESTDSLEFILTEERPLAMDTVQQGGAKKVVLGDDDVMQLQCRLFVPNVDVFSDLILREAHSLWYYIHPSAMKMHRELKQHYWWRRMKKDIIGLVSRCLNCHQVKYEHQTLYGLTQKMIIPE
ncbi:uncharacterized protein [Nicotiana tomentosiformis]|uniref:uncharacterized protein n=1 Tax=Nicotiana tomentosiformis TaxID=4098 RepID=UPI00388C57B5